MTVCALLWREGGKGGSVSDVSIEIYFCMQSPEIAV